MQKRTYNIPTVEITMLQTQRLMKFGDTSGKGDYVGAPKRREDAVF